MELLLDIIFELIVEGSVEVAKNRKISKWIRYPLVVLISLFIIAIIGLLTFVGFALVFEGEIYAKLGGILFLIFDIILIISAVKNIKKEIEMKKVNSNLKVRKI